MKIALLLPSRSRIQENKRFLDSLQNTIENPESVVVYYGLDSDDSEREELTGLLVNPKYTKFKTHITVYPYSEKFPGLGVLWNKLAQVCDCEIFAMVGNDMVFRTRGWDTHILQEFSEPQNLKLVYCNDDMRGPGNKFYWAEPLAVNSFIHRKYYDLLGYYVQESFKHGYHDTYLHNVFTKLGRIVYRSDIHISHLHYSFGEMPIDETAKRLKSAYNECQADRLWNEIQPKLNNEVEVLKKYIHETNS